MKTDTLSRKAFEFATKALSAIDKYQQTRNVRDLQQAQTSLDDALREDREYLRARYYSAIVTDMIGRASDAVPIFEKILAQSPPFAEEVRYNLGAALYHQYSRRFLDQAANHFSAIIAQTKDTRLKLLASANLAQTYAMSMLPKDPHQPDRPEIERFFKASSKLAKQVLNALPKHLEPVAVAEATWMAYNA